MTSTQIMNYALITIYIEIYNPCPESNFMINKDSFNFDSIYGFMKSAVPAAVLFAADWIGFEIQILLSSYLGEVSFAANVYYFNFATLIFMIPLGISYAASSLVGNCIGKNNFKLAKMYGLACTIVGFILLLMFSIFLYFYKGFVMSVYTENPEIEIFLEKLLTLYIIFGPIDSVQVVLNGVIKGIGLQFYASIACLIILFPINVPMCVILGFYLQYGLMGLWYGQYTSIILLVTSYTTIVLLADWKNIAQVAHKELTEENEKLTTKAE